MPHGLSAESGRQLLQRGDEAGAQEAAGEGRGGHSKGVMTKKKTPKNRKLDNTVARAFLTAGLLPVCRAQRATSRPDAE